MQSPALYALANFDQPCLVDNWPFVKPIVYKVHFLQSTTKMGAGDIEPETCTSVTIELNCRFSCYICQQLLIEI